MKKTVKIVIVLIVASFIALVFFLFQKKEKIPAPQPQSNSIKQPQVEEKNSPQNIKEKFQSHKKGKNILKKL